MLAPILFLLDLAEVKTIIIIILTTRQENTPCSILAPKRIQKGQFTRIRDTPYKQLPVTMILFDANRNQDNILYKKEFDECANSNKNLKIIYSLDIPDNDWKGEQGYINQTMVTKYLSSTEMDNSIFYICGPPGMLNAKKKLLQVDLAIPKERIKIEAFTGY